MSKEVIVVHNSGLGNRFRVLAGILALQKRHPLFNIRMLWTQHSHCGAPIEAVLDVDSLPQGNLEITNVVNDPDQQFFSTLEDNGGNPLVVVMPHTEFIDVSWFSDVDTMLIFDYVWKPIPGTDIYDMLPEYVEMLKTFRWNAYVQKEVDDYLEKYDLSQCQGVHVRRGDTVPTTCQQHFKCIDTWQFHEALQDNARPIFLATEDIDILNEFEEQYPYRIFNYECRSFDRRSPRAIQDAMVQMLLLSKCHGILGGKSSFSEISARLGDISKQDLIPRKRE